MHRRVTVVESVYVCVCLSVKSHVTSGGSVHPENTVTYLAGNWGQNICGVFSETVLLQRSSTAPLKAICTVSHFPAESAHVHYSQYTWRFEFRELPLVITGLWWCREFCTSLHSFPWKEIIILCSNMTMYILNAWISTESTASINGSYKYLLTCCGKKSWCRVSLYPQGMWSHCIFHWTDNLHTSYPTCTCTIVVIS